MTPSKRPNGPAVQLHLYPHGVAVDADVLVDTQGELWLSTPDITAPWYGPLPLSYVEEAELARIEAWRIR